MLYKLLPCLFLIQSTFAAFQMPQYCSVVHQCLQKVANGCSETDLAPNPDIQYDASFCGPVKELFNRGIDINDASARRAYFQMGNEYRMAFIAEGVLPISLEMMQYNLNNIPFSTFLINAYQETSYEARYTSPDKQGFYGTNGKNLKGDFVWLSRLENNTKNVIFGTGKVSVLAWKLGGDAVAILDIQKISQKELKYKLTCFAFPANSMLNGIMKMSIFQNTVKEKIQEIIDHIQKSALEYAKGNKLPIQKSKALTSGVGQVWLSEFDKIVLESGYEQKVEKSIDSTSKK